MGGGEKKVAVEAVGAMKCGTTGIFPEAQTGMKPAMQAPMVCQVKRCPTHSEVE
jgi:hypothetical protein